MCVTFCAVLRRDFEVRLLILNQLTSEMYPGGVSKNFINYFPVLGVLAARRWAGIGMGAHELSMRRKGEMIGKEGGKRIRLGMRGMGWAKARGGVDNAKWVTSTPAFE